MSDPQRLMLQGRIVELEARQRELDALIKGDIESIGYALYWQIYDEGIAELDMAKFDIIAKQLRLRHAEYQDVSRQLRQLRERL